MRTTTLWPWLLLFRKISPDAHCLLPQRQLVLKFRELGLSPSPLPTATLLLPSSSSTSSSPFLFFVLSWSHLRQHTTQLQPERQVSLATPFSSDRFFRSLIRATWKSHRSRITRCSNINFWMKVTAESRGGSDRLPSFAAFNRGLRGQITFSSRENGMYIFRNF